MSNRAYLKVWCRDLSPESLALLLRGFLETIPFSRTRPGFTQFTLRAIDTAETPLLERDLRAVPATPGELIEALGESLQMDSALEVEGWWDLWLFDSASGQWTEGPQRLELLAYGTEFEDGIWRESGHFSADLGFEHLFTGHAGLLANGASPSGSSATPQDPVEAEFLRRMADSESLREYSAHTRENIRRLKLWVQRIAQALPLERFALTSEGEEDFEGRLEEIETAN